MGSTARSCYLPVGVVLVVLLAVFVLPGYGEILSKVSADTKRKVDGLIEKLKDEDSKVRQKAAYELSKIGPATKDAVPPLMMALKDEDKSVRVYAADALGRIDPTVKERVPVIIEGLKDKDWTGRSAAIALGKIGIGAVPVLIDALKDNEAGLLNDLTDSISQSSNICLKVPQTSVLD